MPRKFASGLAPKPKHPAGPPMTLGNMRALGVQRLIASCLNDACRHVALIDVSGYPADTEVPWFRPRVVFASAAAGGITSTFGQTGKSNRRSRALTGKVWR